jgi:Sec-independent protein translocase protein TatA
MTIQLAIRLGAQELGISLLIILILFGGTCLPKLAWGSGESLRSLKEVAVGEEDTNSAGKKRT